MEINLLLFIHAKVKHEVLQIFDVTVGYTTTVAHFASFTLLRESVNCPHFLGAKNSELHQILLILGATYRSGHQCICLPPFVNNSHDHN